MKKLLFLLFIPFVTFSQSTDGVDICLALQSNNFTTDAEAERALTRIMNASGLAKNFALIPCDNISNAVAVSYRGERYIIYDKKFMSLISSRTNDWSNLTILAHEVGHHLNGHSIDLSMAKIVEPKSLAEKRKQELEADEFAGFIMAKLGAPLSSVLSSISLITTDDDDTYSTHPKRSRRLERLRFGFNKGNKEKIVSIPSKETKKEATVPKKSIAIEKKVESAIGSIDGVWNLIDDSENPFSESKYSAYVKGKSVGLDSDVVFYINKKNGNELPEFFIENIQEVLKGYVSKVNSLTKKSRAKYASYEYHKLDFSISIAIDKDIITTFSNIEFFDKTGMKNRYNFRMNDKSKINISKYTINDLIEAMRKGKQLYLKINNYSILGISTIGEFSGKRQAYSIIEEDIKDHNVIFKFSLKGSSDALRWYN